MGNDDSDELDMMGETVPKRLPCMGRVLVEPPSEISYHWSIITCVVTGNPPNLDTQLI